MKNQIYIFLVIISIITACKTDSPIVEPTNIFYWKSDNPKGFIRENSIIDYHSDILSPLTVTFEAEKIANNSYNTNLWLSGGDSIVFANQDFCYNPLTINKYVSDSLEFSNNISIDYQSSGEIICAPTDTFYIGFKRTYSNSHRTTFGWFRVYIPLIGFYKIDEMGWNYANHQASKIGQKK